MDSPSKLIEVVRKPAAASAGGYATVQEEGVSLTARTTLNFIGASVTAADDVPNTRTNVTITAGAIDIKTTEQDFGTTPTSYGQWTISDAGVSATSQIDVSVSAIAPAALRDGVAADGDEADMEPMDCYAQNMAIGSFLLTAEVQDGPVTGPYVFQYTLG